MIILGIETSCDETAAAVVKAEGDFGDPKFEVLGSSLISQANLHAEYGGVYPNLAKREHKKNLPYVYKDALKEASVSEDQIDVVAVTVGPGLEPALWVGINFAEELGKKLSVPVIPTNHMLGHVASVLLENRGVEFPAIALLVSGGHTELVLLKNWKEKNIIGKTRDDAVGEAFDKVARMLGLPYPGGPKISRLASEGRKFENEEGSGVSLPRPMINSDDYDFSFSGLKTAVLYHIRNITGTNIRSGARAERGQVSGSNISNGREEAIAESTKIQIAREFEDAVIDVLTTKTKRAIEEFGAKSLIIGGGVIANRELREAFKKLSTGLDTSLFLPDKKLSTDNAIMIAMASYIETDCGKNLPRPSSLRSDEGGQDSPTLSALGNLKIS